MTIPGPMLILGIPAAVAVILQLLRRWTVLSAWLSALTAAILGFVVAFFPLSGGVSLGTFNIELGSPFIVLGRVLLIETVDQLPLGFLFFTAAFLFILAWRLLPHSNFFPVGLGMTTLLAGVLIVEQVVFAALLVEMTAILAVFPLHEPGEAGSHIQKTGARALGGLRYMAYASLSLPGLMVTQLLLDMFAIFPNDTGLLNTAAALLIVSFAILLGAVPFQSWLSMVAVDGSPPVVTFLFTANIGVVWFMLLAYLQSYAWLGKLTIIGPLFTVVGLLMMVVGSLLAASHRRLGRLVAYATLVDNGALLVALGTGQSAGIALSVLTLLARPLSLGLMTMGLEGLRRIGGGDDANEAVQGAAWQAPWRAVAFIMGGVALAGFPVSLGFTARWGLYHLVSSENFFQAVLALASSAGVMMGVISAMQVLLTRNPFEKKAPVAMEEDRVVVLLIFLLIGATLVVGLFPQAPSRLALQMAEGFTFFNP